MPTLATQAILILLILPLAFLWRRYEGSSWSIIFGALLAAFFLANAFLDPERVYFHLFLAVLFGGITWMERRRSGKGG